MIRITEVPTCCGKASAVHVSQLCVQRAQNPPSVQRYGALAAAVLAAAGLTIAAAPTGNSALAAGRGASVPFVEQEAETAATNGSVIGPNRAAGTLAGEASGRKAVTLSGQGQYVEFTLTAPANSIDFRYSVPDSGNGPGTHDLAVRQRRPQPRHPADLEVRPGTTAGTRSPTTRATGTRTTSTTRPARCSARRTRRAPRSSCRSTRATSRRRRSTSPTSSRSARRPRSRRTRCPSPTTAPPRATRATTRPRSTRRRRGAQPGQGSLDPVRDLHPRPPHHGRPGDDPRRRTLVLGADRPARRHLRQGRAGELRDVDVPRQRGRARARAARSSCTTSRSSARSTPASTATSPTPSAARWAAARSCRTCGCSTRRSGCGSTGRSTASPCPATGSSTRPPTG